MNFSTFGPAHKTKTLGGSGADLPRELDI